MVKGNRNEGYGEKKIPTPQKGKKGVGKLNIL